MFVVISINNNECFCCWWCHIFIWWINVSWNAGIYLFSFCTYIFIWWIIVSWSAGIDLFSVCTFVTICEIIISFSVKKRTSWFWAKRQWYSLTSLFHHKKKDIILIRRSTMRILKEIYMLSPWKILEKLWILLLAKIQKKKRKVKWLQILIYF